jgi:hypothetical protein
MNELARVKLRKEFERLLQIKISAPIVWQDSTTLEALYAEIEAQLEVTCSL